MRGNQYEFGTTPAITDPGGTVHFAPTETPGACQAIVDANPAGTTYFFERGVYRFQNIVPKNNDTFIGEYRTTMTGARVLTNWTVDGARWYASGQTQAGTVTGDPAVFCLTGFERCVYPEDLFFDGVIVNHATSLGAGASGAWFFDYDTDRIYVWDNPNARRVETSVTSHAFSGSATGVTIKNLIIECYATPTATGAIYITGVGGLTVQNCEIRKNHADGIKHSATTSVTHNWLHHNGDFGLAGSGATCTIEHNRINHNGVAKYNPLNAAGGSKWTFTTDLVVRNNHSHDNLGSGLWTDISNVNTLYEYNLVRDNLHEGIFHEISYNAIIRYNKCCSNGIVEQPTPFWISGAGILVTNCTSVQIYNNKVINNWQGIAILDDNSRYTSTDANNGPWGPCRNIDVHHNMIESTYNILGGGRTGLTQAQGSSVPYPSSMNNVFDWNRYRLGNSTAYFVWSNDNYTSAEWQSTGQDPHGSFS